MARYHLIACHVLWRELCHYASRSPHVFSFNFVKQGLHNTPDLLREKLQQAVDEAPDECDAILLGYGLCSNGVAGVKARAKRMVIPRAHDCITLFLGSKERYRDYFDAHPGTYWYTPGWVECSIQPGKERHETLRRDYAGKYGEENADYLMELEQGWMKEYNNAAQLPPATRITRGTAPDGWGGSMMSFAGTPGWSRRLSGDSGTPAGF